MKLDRDNPGSNIWAYTFVKKKHNYIFARHMDKARNIIQLRGKQIYSIDNNLYIE